MWSTFVTPAHSPHRGSCPWACAQRCTLPSCFEVAVTGFFCVCVFLLVCYDCGCQKSLFGSRSSSLSVIVYGKLPDNMKKEKCSFVLTCKSLQLESTSPSSCESFRNLKLIKIYCDLFVWSLGGSKTSSKRNINVL